MAEEIMLLEDANLALAKNRGRSRGLAGPVLGSLGVFDNLLPDKKELQNTLAIGAGTAAGIFLSERLVSSVLRKPLKLEPGSTTEMIVTILISLVGAGVIAKALPKQKNFALAFGGGTIAIALLDIVAKSLAPRPPGALTGSGFDFPAIESARLQRAYTPSLQFPAVERFQNGAIVR